MPALPAGSPDAKMAIVNHGTMGYGKNEKDPPYLREKRQGKRSDTEIRKLHGDLETR